MIGHPNWRESKQAFSIICKESPMQSAFRQTLHSSNDNLNVILCLHSLFNKNTGNRLNHVERPLKINCVISDKTILMVGHLPKIIEYIELI